MASLGLVSPAAATEGVTLFLPEQTDDLFLVITLCLPVISAVSLLFIFFCKKLTTFFHLGVTATFTHWSLTTNYNTSTCKLRRDLTSGFQVMDSFLFQKIRKYLSHRHSKCV